MREIVFGTSNPAKVAQISGALKPIEVNVIGIGELGIKVEVLEDGETAQENARKKALAFAKAANRPVLSMDNALFLDRLKPEEQPGIHVRRINGRDDRPSDQELLDYYSSLINRLGGNIAGHWEFALALAEPDGKLQETTVISPRRFSETISKKVVQGYPLESIQIDPESGKYISEMTQDEQDEFWQRMIGKQLCTWIDSVLS